MQEGQHILVVLIEVFRKAAGQTEKKGMTDDQVAKSCVKNVDVAENTFLPTKCGDAYTPSLLHTHIEI